MKITVTEEWAKDGSYVYVRRKYGDNEWTDWELTPHRELPYVEYSWKSDPTPLDNTKEEGR